MRTTLMYKIKHDTIKLEHKVFGAVEKPVSQVSGSTIESMQNSLIA